MVNPTAYREKIKSGSNWSIGVEIQKKENPSCENTLSCKPPGKMWDLKEEMFMLP